MKRSRCTGAHQETRGTMVPLVPWDRSVINTTTDLPAGCRQHPELLLQTLLESLVHHPCATALSKRPTAFSPGSITLIRVISCCYTGNVVLILVSTAQITWNIQYQHATASVGHLARWCYVLANCTFAFCHEHARMQGPYICTSAGTHHTA